MPATHSVMAKAAAQSMENGTTARTKTATEAATTTTQTTDQNTELKMLE
jgi:hypothetical protein